MKTIGLLGGMSWESTVTYYTRINELMNQTLGGLHSAKIKLASVDFEEIEQCQVKNEWEKSGELLGKEAQQLEQAGADFLLICTNTMHKVAPQIASHIAIPILHIADATIAELQANRIKKVALLGTKYTMTQEFYKQRLIDSGIDVWIPNEQDIETVNQIIFDELCHGKILVASKERFIAVIQEAIAAGVEGVILGCTEIGLLIQQKDVTIPVFDTTEIHSQKAVEQALEE
ncbi:aspartate/glutamate racemase family protein [Enterococcus raffinosus]|uniref:Aspartate/glutamate racemase family protein n=1 Tax=Enterococcus raffinosus TaxID=71452 RepID=A0AAW8TGK8_9ENTE|nr:aspartate/glutamate racemase family protein [Enterococcus raffinosus]MDT2524841.1 aspartate/glutamate racemase family protein [Enterococcus raffinosus]MDT2530851.1 aspartate/glutamate racemase family protein [Enterococcus raffinosus]MDT2535492.1 aspartate/glutamate racemase family protein [Enterococcus raffinosus]MDT2545880.1 aspartate/glutamate racemase family protein [Enterococcus raffinosus]MDT2556421.1 aspartate/glutamate racemase family protein [Enterococcus raffinosus]